MYSSFHFGSFGSYYNQNTPNEQHNRVRQLTSSTNIRSIVDKLENDKSPATFASVVGFSLSLLPGEDNTKNMNTVPYQHQQALKERCTSTNRWRCHKSFKLNQAKEFSDYSNMPMLTSRPNSSLTSSKRRHIKENATTSFSFNRSEQPSNNSTSPSILNPINIVSTIFQNCQRMTSAYLQKTNNQTQQNWSNSKWQCSKYQEKKSRTNFANQKPIEKTLLKNYHEKVRTNLEQSIHEDVCDLDSDPLNNNVKEDISIIKTAIGVSDQIDDSDPPFLIYSLEEFPAIISTMEKPLKSTRKKKVRCQWEKKRVSPRKTEDDFVIIASEASMSTPPFEPPRISLCEKIINSPKKLIPSSTCFSIPLKPILKLSTPCRTMSESSDDWIEFAHETTESLNELDGYETNSTSDESEDEDYRGASSESESEDEIDANVPQQIDSGFEERKVSSVHLKIISLMSITFHKISINLILGPVRWET